MSSMNDDWEIVDFKEEGIENEVEEMEAESLVIVPENAPDDEDASLKGNDLNMENIPDNEDTEETESAMNSVEVESENKGSIEYPITDEPDINNRAQLIIKIIIGCFCLYKLFQTWRSPPK